MIIIIELLFIVLLAMMLFMIYTNERSTGKRLLPFATIEECWSGAERRQHVRFNKTLVVHYIVKKKLSRNYNGRSVDISEGGMKLLLEEKLAMGTILLMRIDLPEVKVMAELEGQVVWSEDSAAKCQSDKRLFCCGIKFCRIKEPSGRHLIDYIHSIATGLGV